MMAFCSADFRPRQMVSVMVKTHWQITLPIYICGTHPHSNFHTPVPALVAWLDSCSRGHRAFPADACYPTSSVQPISFRPDSYSPTLTLLLHIHHQSQLGRSGLLPVRKSRDFTRVPGWFLEKDPPVPLIAISTVASLSICRNLCVITKEWNGYTAKLV